MAIPGIATGAMIGVGMMGVRVGEAVGMSVGEEASVGMVGAGGAVGVDGAAGGGVCVAASCCASRASCCLMNAVTIGASIPWAIISCAFSWIWAFDNGVTAEFFDDVVGDELPALKRGVEWRGVEDEVGVVGATRSEFFLAGDASPAVTSGLVVTKKPPWGLEESRRVTPV